MIPRTVFEATEMAGGGAFVPQPCPEATNARPGSSQKIAILRARLEAGVEMHHPKDQRLKWEPSLLRSLPSDYGEHSGRGRVCRRKVLDQ